MDRINGFVSVVVLREVLEVGEVMEVGTEARI